MKKLILVVLVLAVAGMVNYAFAATASQTVTASATVTSTFDLAFYPRPGIDAADNNIAFPTGAITFPSISGAEAMVYPTGRSVNDNRSDVGLLCLSNQANNVTANRWGVRMSQTGNIPSDNIIVYINGQAFNRNVNPAVNLGGIQQSVGWHKVDTTNMILYRADDNHLLTTPWGTLITLSFAIIPSGKFTDNSVQICNGSPLPAGSYNASILFTMANGV